MGNTRKSKHSGRATIYLSNEMKGLLDSVAARRGMTRSEAAIEAISEWVRRQEEEDFERAYGISREIREQSDRLAAMVAETRLATDIVLENIREVSSSANRTDYEELRRRALARRRTRSKNSQNVEAGRGPEDEEE